MTARAERKSCYSCANMGQRPPRPSPPSPVPPICADTGAPKDPRDCWNVRCQLGGTCCRTDGMEGRKQCWECKAIEPNPHKPGCAYSVQKFQAPEWDDPACREAQMVVIERDATGKPTVWCDPEIADLIRALNSGGVPTEASCSGHGEKPGWIALKDGRQLTIVQNLDSFKRLIGADGVTRLDVETVCTKDADDQKS